MYLRGLCCIADRSLSPLLFEDMVLRVLEAGIGWIQYRDKESERRLIYEEAVKLRKITRDFKAVLIINDHADIAYAVDADGVHLGQDDLPLNEARKIMKQKIIGISTHSMEQAKEAEKMGADYIGCGPVFHTSTKDAGDPKGLNMLREIRREIRIPVVAIGGITPDNVGTVLAEGADAVAVASALLRGKIEKNTSMFLDIIRLLEQERL
ncbi:MAG: thiamine phosphate synthase [Thermodesulfovibrionales bacterium]|nr:thiamine phosphate synthase [Thermodesulfovibrionales bacterium]